MFLNANKKYTLGLDITEFKTKIWKLLDIPLDIDLLLSINVMKVMIKFFVDCF